MKHHTIQILLNISRGGLLLAAALFLGVTLFGDGGNHTLCAALGCVILSSLFSLIPNPSQKQQEEQTP